MDFLTLMDIWEATPFNIFEELKEVLPFPESFGTTVINTQFLHQYGDRLASPLLLSYFIDGELTPAATLHIGNMIKYKYQEAWKRYAAIYNIEYNPISNYDREREESIIINESTRGENQVNKGGTIKNEGLNTAGITVTTEENNDISSYGWNGGGAQPTNKTNTRVTSTPNGEDRASNTQTIDTSDTENTSNTRDGTTITKEKTSGNIGVTTTQQMIQSEIDLWSNFNLVDRIYKDIANELTCPVF